MQCMYKCGLYYRTAHTHIRDTSSWCTCFCRDFVHSPSHTIMYNRNFRKTYFITKNRNAVFSIKKRNKYGKNGTVGISGIVMHEWLYHACKFSSHAIDSWVQTCRFDIHVKMSNLQHWSLTFVVHLLQPCQKVTCACTSRRAQRSAHVNVHAVLLARLLVRRRVVRPGYDCWGRVDCGGLKGTG